MKKAVWTLNINDYAPELTALTYPLMQHHADRIGADFRVITERKFPGWPVTYEKLQIYELGQGNDWNLFVDSDALIHPDLYDITEHVPKDTVLQYAHVFAGFRWKYDDYFRRDGRNVSVSSWFMLASDWCMDFWRPLDDLSFEEACRNITPLHSESVEPSYFVDDYTLSRNVAKYGLKAEALLDLQQRVRGRGRDYLWHTFIDPLPTKVARARATLTEWGIDPEALVEGQVCPAVAA